MNIRRGTMTVGQHDFGNGIAEKSRETQDVADEVPKRRNVGALLGNTETDVQDIKSLNL